MLSKLIGCAHQWTLVGVLPQTTDKPWLMKRQAAGMQGQVLAPEYV